MRHWDRVIATDTEDALTYSAVMAPLGFEVDPQTGLINFPTTGLALGDYPITLRPTDERGLASNQSFTLTVSADETAPAVSILLSTEVLNIGDTVTITILARDNVSIASQSLTIAGQPTPLDANGQATFTATTHGLPTLIATATDPSGNVITETATLRVLDPTDTQAPLITITSPSPADVITYLTDIIGSVDDPENNLEFSDPTGLQGCSAPPLERAEKHKDACDPRIETLVGRLLKNRFVFRVTQIHPCNPVGSADFKSQITMPDFQEV